ncbi:Protein FMP25, mitochondrial [Leucoagaricus sp. SymC.cos]|nr:Protein FMP25, mitochondrial [Leucoagaricus sp. SymC.cos]
MLRRAGQNFKPHLRRLYHQAHSVPRPQRNTATVAALASGITISSYLWYTNSHRIYNDAETTAGASFSTPLTPQSKFTSPEAEHWRNQDILHALIWGSNNYQVLNASKPDAAGVEGESKDRNIRYPTIAKWLGNVALRDMQLHRRHAACVDARGDVYQWGDGFFGSTALQGAAKPILTLKGKASALQLDFVVQLLTGSLQDIVKIQLTEHKVYALSASGKVYVFAADVLSQEIPTGASHSSGSWFPRGNQTSQYQELASQEALGWMEKFVSIVAGENHLLALTNKGRTFAHPVNKEANRYGQLGLRSFEIPDPDAAVLKTKPANLKVELIPKTVQESSGKARITPFHDVATDLSNIDDSTIHWCTHLYEIPALRGVETSQISAGARTSFIRTPTGRVLGWGANEYGQIGLGVNVTLDTITIPTEVILWRMISKTTRSKCLNVTARGDLTSFTVERSSAGSPTTTDLLMCGNGQNGGLGNNTYTNVQGNPVRVKNVSGLLQCDDRTKQLEAIKPTDVVISPTGHVLVALDSSAESDGVGGQDLMVWGKNYDYELGNGKKSSTAMPVNLDAPDGERLMLMKKKAKEVNDLAGKVWKRNVSVEQQAVAGYGNTAVYWKIVR